jgi:methylase of polypeptide subunit release factors
MAVKSTLENAALNGFKDKITAIESDLFESPSNPPEGEYIHLSFEREGVRQFDIIFQPSYYKGNPKIILSVHLKGGENLDVVERFASQAKNFLNLTDNLHDNFIRCRY